MVQCQTSYQVEKTVYITLTYQLLCAWVIRVQVCQIMLEGACIYVLVPVHRSLSVVFCLSLSLLLPPPPVPVPLPVSVLIYFSLSLFSYSWPSGSCPKLNQTWSHQVQYVRKFVHECFDMAISNTVILFVLHCMGGLKAPHSVYIM